MTRSCDACGQPYQAQRSTSKFCSSSCRVRASQGAVAPASVPEVPLAGGPVAVATRKQLEAAGRLDTMLGEVALALAARIDGRQDTGAGMASVTRELRSTMEAALAGVADKDSPVILMRDELAARRRKSA